MNVRPLAFAAALALGVAGFTTAALVSPAGAANDFGRVSIERGRYIAKVGGCNDCHTPNYAATAGGVPEKDWLVGDEVGWKGAWGTTYPANLRMVLGNITEDEWVRVAHGAQFRPPMPWFNLRDMSEDDLRSFHRFVRSLGVAGRPAPAYLPPGASPRGPAIVFPEPSVTPQQAASR
jgi:mono/diheme cytochrome c family protein